MNILKQPTAAGILALLIFACSGSAVAADKELLDILLENGAINQSQYDRLLKKEAIEADDVDEIVTSLDSGGLSVETRDGDYSFEIGTRLHAEASTHKGDLPDDNMPVNGTELRRARFETSGKFHQDWRWAAEIDFADDETAVKDFRVGYKTAAGTQFDFGHQKQPYSLAVEMSSNDLPFIERSVDTFLLVPFLDRAIGFRAERSGKNWFAAGGAFGDSVGPSVIRGDEGWGFAGRLILSPILSDKQVLHLGLRAAVRTPSRENLGIRLRDETTHISNLRIVDTGFISDVDRTDITGFEAAWAKGPFSLVGEYTAVEMRRDNEPDLSFDGWNIYGSWSVTGESRAEIYKMSAGEFKRLKPQRDFSTSEGTWGAWEFVFRYAALDLNDQGIVGGAEDVITTGLNWYLNNNMRLMFEWSQIVDTDGSSELRLAADGLNIYQFRTQYTF